MPYISRPHRRTRGRRLIATALATLLALPLVPQPANARPVAEGPVEAFEPEPMFRGSKGWLHTLWSDNELMLVASYSSVHMHCRDGRRTISPTLYGLSKIAATGSGGLLKIAAVGNAGGILTWRAGTWEKAQVPAIDSEDLVGVAFSSDRKIVAAGEEHALYIGTIDNWQVFRYPEAIKEVRGFAQTPDGRVLLGGDHGIYSFAHGKFRRLPLGDLSETVHDIWVANDHSIWAVTTQYLVHIQDSQVKAYDAPIFGRLRAITGVETADGPVVVVAAQSDLAFFHNGKFKTHDGDYSFPEDLHLDAANEVVYIAHRDGLTHVAFDHPNIIPRRRPAKACPLPESARVVEGTTTPSSGRAELKEAKKRPAPTRDPMPILRTSFGAGIGKLADGQTTAGFAFDLMAGGTLGVHRYVAIYPEVGYGHARLRGNKQNLFLIGVGPLFGNEAVAVGVLPRLALGNDGGRFGIGMRNGLVTSIAMDIFAIEVAHQWLRIGREDVHEARVMASINVLPILAVILFAAAMGRISRRRWRR